MTNTQELRRIIRSFKEKFEKPYLAIENGGNFNGTIYTKKIGSGRNFDLGIYVSNQYYSLGRFGKEHVQEIKDAFYLLLAEGFVKEEKQEENTEDTEDFSNINYIRTLSANEIEKIVAERFGITKDRNSCLNRMRVVKDGKRGFLQMLSGAYGCYNCPIISYPVEPNGVVSNEYELILTEQQVTSEDNTDWNLITHYMDAFFLNTKYGNEKDIIS